MLTDVLQPVLKLANGVRRWQQNEFRSQDLADIFRTIADLLEIKGEVIYKILAYRKAADSLTETPRRY